MASDTIFGPQGANAASTLPVGTRNNRYGAGVDTWVQDCGAGNTNGTILNAAFFNNIIGNLRNVVKAAVRDGATFDACDGDMDALLKAIKFYAGSGVSAGEGTQFVGNQLGLDFPSLKNHFSADIDPARDRIAMYDESQGDYAEAALGQAVRAALKSNSGFIVISLGADGRVGIEVDPSQFIQQIMSLPLTDGIDGTVDFVPVWDASQNRHARLPIDNLIQTANLTGVYTPATLPVGAQAPQIGATAYVTGMGGGGGANGMAFWDGTNWRKGRNNVVVV